VIKKAKEFDILIFANKAPIDSLVDLEVNQKIPSKLYWAVV